MRLSYEIATTKRPAICRALFLVRGAESAFVEGGADLFDVGSVGADGFVELVAGDLELVSPVGDVGGHFGVDLFRIVGAFEGVVFVEGVGFVTLAGLFFGIAMFGDGIASFECLRTE
jgi:hypothetical protein